MKKAVKDKSKGVLVYTYRGYTFISDFTETGMMIPTYVKEIDYEFKDVSQAKRYVDTSFGEFYDW